MEDTIIAKHINLISKDTKEILSINDLVELLDTKKNPTSYWGVAPTGPPHIGYYRTISKQMDFIKAGLDHKILIADIHAYLDDIKAPWEETKYRGEIYKKCFQLLGLDKNVEYIFGSDIQLNSKYYQEFLKSSALVTSDRALRAASETCRLIDPKVSSLIYPIWQSLDCWALDIDIAYGGIDQRHAYMLTKELLPKLGHKPPILIFTELGKSLTGKEKMSASDKKTRLELFAEPEDIRNKIQRAYCPQKSVEDNPILDYSRYFIFPRIDKFTIERPKKYGGDVIYVSYEELERDYVTGKIHPQDLKNTVAEYLIYILKPVRDYFEKHTDMLDIYRDKNGYI